MAFIEIFMGRWMDLSFSVGVAVTAFFFVEGLRRWALRKQVLDVPNERSSHSQPTPRGGGLAIVVIALTGVWALYPFLRAQLSAEILLVYSVGAVAVAFIGWMDDLRPLTWRVRMGVHVLIAVAALYFIGWWRILELPYLGAVDFGWFGLLLSFLWIVGLINAYNFMDGIDGLAGGQAVAAGCGWFVLGWLSGAPLLAFLGLAVASGSLGFLAHNWPPARIFMGDVGSTFLGFTFALLPLMALGQVEHAPLWGVLLVWPFVFDAAFTFLRRLSKGENVFAAHRSHLYQRLVIAGLSHQRVTVLYLGLVGGGIAAWLLNPALPVVLALLLWLGTVLAEKRRSQGTAH
jgi:UDP-N-acetylmuramyl pentapeptide phosphotransferase/UDP-N-acetylglucosamine-1-phosphate transferase